MTTTKLLSRLKNGDTTALEQIMRTYSAYVVTIIRNRSRNMLSEEDIEEIASDVFITLWNYRGRLKTAQLKQWLGSVSRNKTVDHLRRKCVTVPLDDVTLSSGDSLWEQMAQKERQALVASALDTLSSEDKMIFFRYYTLCQTAVEISKIMGMNTATVRTRLSRGREKIKQYLIERGFADET